MFRLRKTTYFVVKRHSRTFVYDAGSLAVFLLVKSKLISVIRPLNIFTLIWPRFGHYMFPNEENFPLWKAFIT